MIQVKTKYAGIVKSGKTFMIIDTANQCHFASTSETKAKNRLNKILKAAGCL